MNKILVVEDDQKLNLALSLRLKLLGHQVVQAHDGKKAVALISEYEPELILMDINLPAEDGFSVAESVQSITDKSAAPIIFITASKLPGLRERAAELGAAGFLEKPFEEGEIHAAIDQPLEK